MQIRVGYDLAFEFPQPTPVILTLNIHHSRLADIIVPDLINIEPWVPLSGYRDVYGNWCTRILAPPGRTRVFTSAIVNDPGSPDRYVPNAIQHSLPDLPEDTLLFLLGSRYCETDLLSQTAWNLFGNAPFGWGRVQAICDFVHNHISFGYQHASPNKTALGVFNERRGVCRDFAHLAITFCRCMNIPARYCTGYLGDIGVPPVDAPMDFSGWFEAYVGGEWHTFDARHNTPRIGRVLIARGRDAADVAISSSFGPHILAGFNVVTEEIL